MSTFTDQQVQGVRSSKYFSMKNSSVSEVETSSEACSTISIKLTFDAKKDFLGGRLFHDSHCF